MDVGDWNGKRTQLQQQGYDLNFGYTGEMASLIDAQRSSSHRTEYADQFVLGLIWIWLKLQAGKIPKRKLLSPSVMVIHFLKALLL